MPRVFVAIDIPGNLKELINRDIERMKDYGIRASFPRMEALHVTIKFLGEVSLDMVSKVVDSLKEVVKKVNSFDLTVKNRGVFPNSAKPRVVWVGIESSPHLERLKELVDDNLERLGFTREDREFRPHVTIARLKWLDGAGKDFIRKLTKEEMLYGAFKVDKVILYESILKPEGAVYRVIEEFYLEEKDHERG